MAFGCLIISGYVIDCNTPLKVSCFCSNPGTFILMTPQSGGRHQNDPQHRPLKTYISTVEILSVMSIVDIQNSSINAKIY